MTFLFLLSFWIILSYTFAAFPVPRATEWCNNCVMPPSIAIEKFFATRNAKLGDKVVCGDGICNIDGGETCSTCPKDCNKCKFTTAITSCVNKNEITLTFDDGPTVLMEPLLDELKNLDIKASFFINGAHIMSSIDVSKVIKNATDFTYGPLVQFIKRAYDEGHIIGSHTYNHMGMALGTTGDNVASSLGYVPREVFMMQMLMNELVIYDILKVYPKTFRPPYLEYNSTLINLWDTMGYVPISINVDSKDYEAKSFSQIMQNINAGVTFFRDAQGLILLHHDGYELIVQSLADEVKELQSSGLKFVDLATCLNVSSSSFYHSEPSVMASNAPPASTPSASASAFAPTFSSPTTPPNSRAVIEKTIQKSSTCETVLITWVRSTSLLFLGFLVSFIVMTF